VKAATAKPFGQSKAQQCQGVDGRRRVRRDNVANDELPVRFEKPADEVERRPELRRCHVLGNRVHHHKIDGLLGQACQFIERVYLDFLIAGVARRQARANARGGFGKQQLRCARGD
jgi:hypothetical protein